MVKQPNSATELYVVIFSATIFFMFLAGFIVYFILLYQKRQNQNRIEREMLESNFRQEILKAQLEIQEETFMHVSRELHDNISQVLSFVKLNLAMINSNDEQKEKINDNRELIAHVITDLRDLSKSLSSEHISKQGLVKTIETEVNKLHKSGIIAASLTVAGEVTSLGEQRELVLFRIFQEALNNTIKHSGADHLSVHMNYTPETFSMTIKDNGNGFVINAPDNTGGSGLTNMENRAGIIGATATIESSPGAGCIIRINLNLLQQRNFIDG